MRKSAVSALAGIIFAFSQYAPHSAAVMLAPLAAPNLDFHTAGTVTNFVRQPNGGVIVYGTFDEIDGAPATNLVRIAPDGTIDPNWHAYIQGVYEVRLAADPHTGDVYVDGMGSFVTINGVIRHVAKLSGVTGEVDDSWHAPVSESGWTTGLAVGADGAVYIADDGGKLSKLSKVNGSIEKSWTIGAYVVELAIDAASNVYVAAGTSDEDVFVLARIDAQTGDINPKWNATTNGRVTQLAPDMCGHLYALGVFSTANGADRNTVARFMAASGQLDTGWQANVTGTVQALAVDSACAPYVGGAFNKVDDSERSMLAKLSASTGHVDAGWIAPANLPVYALMVDGGILHVGGSFRTISNVPRLAYARLDKGNAQLGPARDFELPAYVERIVQQSDGGIIVTGDFGRIGDVPRQGLARLHPDGSLDLQWEAPGLYWANPIAVGPHDEIYAASYRRLVRLDAHSGAIDPSFDMTFKDGYANAIAVAPNGDVYVGGQFRSFADAPHPYLVALSPFGQIYETPHLVPNYNVNALRFSPDGQLYVGGSFSTMNGEAVPSIVRVVDLHPDPGWIPMPYGSVSDMELSSFGDAYVASMGNLRRISLLTGEASPEWGVSHFYYVDNMAVDQNDLYLAGSRTDYIQNTLQESFWRVSLDTGLLDGTWDVDARRFTSMMPFLNQGIAVLRDGTVLVGGSFTSINGVPRRALAAFSLTGLPDDGIFDNGFD